MEELISRVAAAAGMDVGMARKSVAIMIGFLKREGPTKETSTLLATIPGASESAGTGGGGAIFGRGLLAVFNELTAAGLGLAQIKSVAKTFLRYAEEKAGKPTVEAVIGRISGLSQFV